MRIATWNLERPDPADTARNRARMEKIREIDADLWILTETHEVIDLSDTHHGVATTSSARKPQPGEACATVWSRWPILQLIDTSDPSEAVCVEVAHPEGSLLVYGSIIAYAGYTGPDGMSRMWNEHYRFIEWHGRDWKRLRAEFPGHRLITGGYYNLIRCVMQQTAIETGTAIGELSFKGVLDHAAASQDSYLAHRGKARRLARHHASVMATCATKQLDIRPSRHEPRALKRRCKDYPPLSSPRGTYREKSNK